MPIVTHDEAKRYHKKQVRFTTDATQSFPREGTGYLLMVCDRGVVIDLAQPGGKRSCAVGLEKQKDILTVPLDHVNSLDEVYITRRAS
jgi:hypothetical protein